MKKYLDSTEKINSIRLKLRHPVSKHTIWVLVEGEDDCKVYSKFINAPRTSVEQVHGGIEHLRIAVSTLIQETEQVIGIRDADFLHFNVQNETIKHLFVTDCHDIELLMISNDRVVQNVLYEYLPEEKFEIVKLRDRILNSLIFISNIRWYNDLNNIELNFKGLPLGNLYDSENLIISEVDTINEINKRSPNKKSTITISTINKITHRVVDLMQLTNGHDFVKAFALFISSKATSGISNEKLSQSIRLSYTKEDFQKSILYSDLLSYNQKYQIFSN